MTYLARCFERLQPAPPPPMAGQQRAPLPGLHTSVRLRKWLELNVVA